MIDLVYYSIANTEITSEVISNIVETARTFNSKNNITGCLLYHKNIFLQLLEGEKEDVNNLFNTIKKDKRHTNITLIIEETISKRMFTDWSMAFHEIENKETDMHQAIKNIIFFSDNKDKESDAIDLFWNMAKQIVIR